jgi:hypothetical protein
MWARSRGRVAAGLRHHCALSGGGILFVVGFARRVMGWARSAVPFRITTTCGQQSSLPWFKQAKIDNPSTTLGVIVRMFLEIVCFRSLFRNTRMKLNGGTKLTYQLELFCGSVPWPSIMPSSPWSCGTCVFSPNRCPSSSPF